MSPAFNSYGTTAENLECVAGWEYPSPSTSAQPLGISARLTDCSLIVPTYKRPNEVSALLRHLAALDPSDLPAEVVVVDGSRENSTEERLSTWVTTFNPPFRVIYGRSKPGLTRQKNVGVDISSGKYLFFLDDDTLPEQGYFREMRAVFANDHQETIGAIGGLIVNEIDRRISFRWRVRLALRLVPCTEPMRYDASGLSLPKALAKPFSGVREVDIVPGGASCFRREVFSHDRFSMFFDGYSNGEDVEMSLRVGGRFRILWCGRARVVHYHAPGGRPPGFLRGKMDVRNRLFIRRRFWPHAPLKASIRFWADVLLLISLDLLLFCRHPGNTSLIRHAAGLAWASAQAMFAPPVFTEPPARREYVLSA